MNNRTTLNAQEAKDYGLIHEIKSELFPLDADLSVIGEGIVQQPPQIQLAVPKQLLPGGPVQHVSVPGEQAYTKSSSLDIGTRFEVS
jgi:hypothetical protein